MELKNFTVPEDTDSVDEETKTEEQTTLEQQDTQESVDEVVKPKRTRRRKRTQTTSRTKAMKTKTCKVVHYNKKAKTLDIDFDGYGVRLKGVKDVTSDEVVVKYKGEIGKPDFQCKLG